MGRLSLKTAFHCLEAFTKRRPLAVKISPENDKVEDEEHKSFNNLSTMRRSSDDGADASATATDPDELLGGVMKMIPNEKTDFATACTC